MSFVSRNVKARWSTRTQLFTGSLACLFVLALTSDCWSEQRVVPYRSTAKKEFLWPSQPPADCPFEKSDIILGIGFTGRSKSYGGCDTWYPSWASDGNQYSPFTDGSINGVGASSHGAKATTGQAKIIGDDPLALTIEPLGATLGPATPYGGRYPCGSLVHNGIWYYGTYCLELEDIPGYTKRFGGHTVALPDIKERIGQINAGKRDKHEVVLSYNWPRLGPFVGFRYSTDYGKTWTDTPHSPYKPIFNEPVKKGGSVKIGAPHFVDFGKNMEHSPDGKAYLVAHGSSDPDPKPRPGNTSWISGDQVYLLRVEPSTANINDASQYEFFAGHDNQGNPVWTKDFGCIKPLVDWNNRCGCVTMTYNAPLKKYLLCVTDGWPTTREMNTYVLESDTVTGPWKLVTFMFEFGVQAYFVNFPSKFISADGRRAWLCYSNNFGNNWFCHALKRNPAGGRYALSLQEVTFLDKKMYRAYAENGQGQAAQGHPVDRRIKSEANLARKATVTATSQYGNNANERRFHPKGAIDGIVSGYPENVSAEWASQDEKEGAMLRLTWDTPQQIDSLWLFDRPIVGEQITSGLLVFSDGTSLNVAELPDDISGGREICFPVKTVKWLMFVATKVSPNTLNVGLSEIAVFGPE